MFLIAPCPEYKAYVSVHDVGIFCSSIQRNTAVHNVSKCALGVLRQSAN